MLTVVVIADRTTYTMRKNYGVQLKCLDTVLETVLLILERGSFTDDTYTEDQSAEADSSGRSLRELFCF